MPSKQTAEKRSRCGPVVPLKSHWPCMRHVYTHVQIYTFFVPHNSTRRMTDTRSFISCRTFTGSCLYCMTLCDRIFHQVNTFFRNLVSRGDKDPEPLSQALQNKEKAVDLFIQSTLGQYPPVLNALIRDPDRVISDPSSQTVDLILGEAYKSGPTVEQLRSVSWVTRAYREFAFALRKSRNAHHVANLNLLPPIEIKVWASDCICIHYVKLRSLGAPPC